MRVLESLVAFDSHLCVTSVDTESWYEIFALAKKGSNLEIIWIQLTKTFCNANKIIRYDINSDSNQYRTVNQEGIMNFVMTVNFAIKEHELHVFPYLKYF